MCGNKLAQLSMCNIKELLSVDLMGHGFKEEFVSKFDVVSIWFRHKLLWQSNKEISVPFKD